MEENILKLFIEKGFLLDKEMFNFLNELKDEEVANEILNKIAFISNEKLITKNLVDHNLDKIKSILVELDNEKKKIVEKFFVNISVSVEVKKEIEIIQKITKDEISENRSFVKVLSSPVILAKKIEVKDFVKHFRNRYVFLKELLQQRNELEGLISIDKIIGNNRNFSIIGIVTSKRITKNKNLLLDVEDLTGKARLLINQNKEDVYKKSKEILLDDVIGFKVSGSRDFLFVNDLFYPDSFLVEKHHTDEEVYALFISDMHLGSTHFLEGNFLRFIDWLNGKNCDEKQKEVLKKIRYLFVLGDSVDGAGIYPGQEKDLNIKDIKKQYEKLAEIYKKIPSYINIIQCAGQHDAVRVAVPQPQIGEDFAKSLTEIKNLYLVSNPSLVEIEGSKDKTGIKVLMYHGAGVIPYIINEIEELRLDRAQSTPAKAIKHLLLRRHIAPTHGGFVYIPNMEEDNMLIKDVPDIITTGDMHRLDIDKYNGVLIICNSCWQTQTAFEEKVGNQPDYCKVPVLNLKTKEIKILDFEGEPEQEDKKIEDRIEIKN
jgi:DNA polymerase II small subunit